MSTNTRRLGYYWARIGGRPWTIVHVDHEGTFTAHPKGPERFGKVDLADDCMVVGYGLPNKIEWGESLGVEPDCEAPVITDAGRRMVEEMTMKTIEAKWVEVGMPTDQVFNVDPEGLRRLFEQLCRLGAKSGALFELRFRRSLIAALVSDDNAAEAFKKIVEDFRDSVHAAMQRLDR